MNEGLMIKIIDIQIVARNFQIEQKILEPCIYHLNLFFCLFYSVGKEIKRIRGNDSGCKLFMQHKLCYFFDCKMTKAISLYFSDFSRSETHSIMIYRTTISESDVIFEFQTENSKFDNFVQDFVQVHVNVRLKEISKCVISSKYFYFTNESYRINLFSVLTFKEIYKVRILIN